MILDLDDKLLIERLHKSETLNSLKKGGIFIKKKLKKH